MSNKQSKQRARDQALDAHLEAEHQLQRAALHYVMEHNEELAASADNGTTRHLLIAYKRWRDTFEAIASEEISESARKQAQLAELQGDERA